MTEDKKNRLGFGSVKEETTSVENKDITSEDIKKQGIIPELVGRLPVIVKLEQLTRDDLKKILTETKNSLVKQYTDLIKLDNVDLVFSEDALDFIADKAHETKTGARGLKGIIEQFMTDIMFEIPSNKNIEAVEIVVNNNELKYITRAKKEVA